MKAKLWIVLRLRSGYVHHFVSVRASRSRIAFVAGCDRGLPSFQGYDRDGRTQKITISALSPQRPVGHVSTKIDTHKIDTQTQPKPTPQIQTR